MNSKIGNFATKTRDFYLRMLVSTDVSFFYLTNKINKKWKHYTIKTQVSIIKKMMYATLLFHLIISLFIIPIEIITVFPLPDGFGSTKPLLSYGTSIMISVVVVILLIFVMYCFHLIKIIHMEAIQTKKQFE